MGDPGNPTSPDPGREPDPEQPGWASADPTSAPPPAASPPPAATPDPTPPATGPPAWGAPPPTWGTPPPGGAGAPGAAPGGGWIPPGAPPRKRRLTWLWILIPVLFVFFAGLIVVIVFAVKALTGPVEATNDYYSLLRDGSYAAAYEERCADFRAEVTQERFVAVYTSDEQARGRVTSYNFSSSEIESDEATTTGTVERGGSEYDVRVELEKEDGDWRVCDIRER